MPAKGDKKIQDPEQLRALMRMKPTLKDTAAFFRCSERTVEQTIRDEFDQTFREFRDENMVETRHMLIRSAIEQGLGGNAALLIFCLKNMCGWHDKHELEHVMSKPIQLQYSLDGEQPKEREVVDVKELDDTAGK